MKRICTFFALCMLVACSMYAQVDKATVQKQADAAKAAGDGLKAADTGDKAWKFDGVIGLNATATGLVNWAAGGKNNVNGLAFAKLHLLYHKNAVAWETNFDTDFGMTWMDQKEDALQKSSDNIKLATKFGWEFKENWYLTVLGGFQSQYANGRDYIDGYNPIISKWLAPSYTDVSVGIDWKKSVNGCDFSVYLSPVAGRISTAYVGDAWNRRYTKEAALGGLKHAWDQTQPGTTEYDVAKAAYELAEKAYDLNVPLSGVGYDAEVKAHTDLASTLKDKYGVVYYKEGNKMYDRDFRAELGLSLKGAIAYKYENLTLGTTLVLFTPYAGKGEALSSYVANSTDADTYYQYSNMNRQFGHFDVDWDVNISYQFLKVLNVTLSTSMKYYNGVLIADKDGAVKERLQFKSVLGLGIGYSF